MTKLKKKLKEKKGMSAFTASFTVLIALMFLLIMSEYLHLYGTVQSITKHMQATVVKTATTNYYNVYGGIREGNSSAHEYAGNHMWNAVVTTEDVTAGLKSTLNLEGSSNTLSRINSEGHLVFALENIESHVTNVSVGTGSADIKLTFHTTATAIVPIRFMGMRIDVRQQIKINSHFIPRY